MNVVQPGMTGGKRAAIARGRHKALGEYAESPVSTKRHS
jgi:hypothetical protein